MKDTIREIYVMEVQKAEKDDISEWEQEMVLSVLERVKDKLEAQEYEEIRDKAFQIASIGEEAGFIRGFIYAFRLFTECLAG